MSGNGQPQTSADGTPPTPVSTTILLVDDNAQNLELLEAYLEELGVQLVLARDGQQALDLVASSPPDLILLDIMMPKVSGYLVCQKIKRDPALRDIPVLMVTALNEVGDVERAVDAGADDFLSKPVNRVELLTRVRSLLKVRQLKLELDRTLAQVRELRDQQGSESR